jgi:hypothetical protein
MQLPTMHPWSTPSPGIPSVVPDGVAATVELRRHPRFPAVEDQARLSWGDGAGSSERPAFLVDISRGGARLTSKDFIPDATTLKISLHGEHDNAAEVLGPDGSSGSANVLASAI